MNATTSKPEWAQSKHDKDNVARQAAGLKPRRRRWPWVMLGLMIVAAIAGFIFIRSQPAAGARAGEQRPSR